MGDLVLERLQGDSAVSSLDQGGGILNIKIVVFRIM